MTGDKGTQEIRVHRDKGTKGTVLISEHLLRFQRPELRRVSGSGSVSRSITCSQVVHERLCQQLLCGGSVMGVDKALPAITRQGRRILTRVSSTVTAIVPCLPETREYTRVLT